ncbi:DNA/RNA nuclease SfsA [Halanaerobiaceae bacterium Z-7014]|uniref:Sugar fermentation stimulation protein homolog n=1 Tax=Halonatronomonas betaini TaxID=2778430 RepID=A0A931F9K6_9FIRM|nr:DNA/RNA nuclease SfsA [Halonatronomonas betaini]MBF8437683.1 DNA/RNA nuclease SfsA [Halonatronomonas betaini]
MELPYIDFSDNLLKAKIIARPNRFVLICEDESSNKIKLHLPDPGRLPLIIKEGRVVYYKPTDNPERKTAGSVILVKLDNDEFVSMNSHLANDLAEVGLENEFFDGLSDYSINRREYTWGNSRFDFLLNATDGDEYLLEVKSVNLVDDGQACFPDAPTKRGVRHLEELIKWKDVTGNLAGVLFIVQQEQAELFKPCEEIDPDFAETLDKAREAGIDIFVYDTNVDLNKIMLNQRIEQNW